MLAFRVPLAVAGLVWSCAPLLAQQMPASASAVAVPSTILATGTPIAVVVSDDVTAGKAKVGDRFGITLLEDLLGPNGTVIPKGTLGEGEVTFSAGRGGFGRNGMLGIAVRHLQVGARKIAIDGRYREEGKQREGAVAVTAFTVGALGAAFIKGGQCTIPKGRVLKARLGEDLTLPLLAGDVPVTVRLIAPAPPVAILKLSRSTGEN
jgi:hypothetical protein